MNRRTMKGTTKNAFRGGSGSFFLWTASRKTVNIVKSARFFVSCQRKNSLAFASKAIYRGDLILWVAACLGLIGFGGLVWGVDEPVQVTLNWEGERPVNRLVYGANNNLMHSPFGYDLKDFKVKYERANCPFLRYPGGTGSNYLHPQSGLSDWERGGGKPRQVDSGKFFAFVRETGAKYSLVLNLCTATMAENRAWLESLERQAIKPGYFELGNELYFGSYSRFFSSGADYVKTAKAYASMIRGVWPKAKIGVVIPSHFYTEASFLSDGRPVKMNRQEQWTTALEREDFYDAVVIHLYSDVGMGRETRREDFLDYTEGFGYAVSHVDGQFDRAMDAVKKRFGGRDVWVTEYGVGGFAGDLRGYRLRYSYLGILHSAYLFEKLLGREEVKVATWHSFIQFLEWPHQVRDDTVLKTRLGYDVFRELGKAVKESDGYVPVSIAGGTDYQGKGKYPGKYSQAAGAAVVNKTGGTVIVINKTEGSCRLNLRTGARPVRWLGAEMFMPRADRPLREAVRDEYVMGRKRVAADEAAGMVLDGYGLALIRFKWEKR